MKFDSINDIKRSGFRGFVAISALQASKCRKVPDKPGVYLVLRPDKTPPVFLSRSVGGHFKGKDPTVPIKELEKAWVEGALVLYVGKAGGPGTAPTLKRRVFRFMQFGQGKAVAKFGGRYIWQLDHSGSLVVCWKPIPNADPRALERQLIQEFKAAYGRRPFANLLD